MNPDFEQNYLPVFADTVTYVTLAAGLWLLVFGLSYLIYRIPPKTKDQRPKKIPSSTEGITGGLSYSAYSALLYFDSTVNVPSISAFSVSSFLSVSMVIWYSIAFSLDFSITL